MTKQIKTETLPAIAATELSAVTGGSIVDKAKRKFKQGVENVKNVTKATVNGAYNMAAGSLGYTNERGEPGARDDAKPFQDDPASKIKY